MLLSKIDSGFSPVCSPHLPLIQEKGNGLHPSPGYRWPRLAVYKKKEKKNCLACSR